MNDDLVTVIRLHFSNGDSIARGADVVEFETSKTNVTVSSEADGFIRYLVAEGAEVPVGTVLAMIYDTQGEAASATAALGEPAAAVEGGPVFSRRARELVERHGIPEARFAGLNFVTEDDVRARLAREETHSVESIGGGASGLEKVPLPPSKRTEIRYLSGVQHGLTSTVSAYVAGGAFDRVGGILKVLRYSFLPLVVHEVARALREHRRFNAYFEDDAIVYHRDVNVGFAVDLGKGLRVPVIRHADELTLREIEDAILERVDAYEAGALTAEHVNGGTFTITDLSAEHVASFTPLVNSRQSSILGIASLDADLDRTLLTLTFDHRVTEAKAAAALLRDLVRRIDAYAPARASEAPCCDRCFKTLDEDRKLDGAGLAKIVRHDGSEGFLCVLCLSGY